MGSRGPYIKRDRLALDFREDGRKLVGREGGGKPSEGRRPCGFAVAAGVPSFRFVLRLCPRHICSSLRSECV